MCEVDETARHLTIEELTEYHFGLAAPVEMPQFQDDDELDISDDPVL